eukprot:gene5111-7122_t
MYQNNAKFLVLLNRNFQHRVVTIIRNGSLNQRLLSTKAPIPFKLADIGEGIAEVELMKWFVKEGDIVKSFDRICEVQSDKATVEITSRYEGKILKIHHEEGSIVKVGSSLLDIIENSGDVVMSSSPELKIDSSPVSITHISSSSKEDINASYDLNGYDIHNFNNSKIQTTPAVRKLAKEYSIDLSSMIGSGPKNRITKEDILLYIQTNSSPRLLNNNATNNLKSILQSQINNKPDKKQEINTSFTPTPIDHHHKTKTNYQIDNNNSSSINNNTHNTQSISGIQKVPIRGVQRLMVKSMTAALQVQHLTYSEEIIFNNLVKLRKDLNIEFEKRGIKLSYMPFLMKAASLSLSEYPILNALVNPDLTEMIYHSNHNIGVAMNTNKGLVVPIVKQVQNKSIHEIAVELNKLQDAATKGSLTESQLSGGTFTMSNIGSIGGTYMVPVVVVPQVAIGAFGRTQTVPRYVDKNGNLIKNFDKIHDFDELKVYPVTIMNVSWSADHRVIDGATVANFSNTWKKYIENPNLLLADLR